MKSQLGIDNGQQVGLGSPTQDRQINRELDAEWETGGRCAGAEVVMVVVV